MYIPDISYYYYMFNPGANYVYVLGIIPSVQAAENIYLQEGRSEMKFCPLTKLLLDQFDKISVRTCVIAY